MASGPSDRGGIEREVPCVDFGRLTAKIKRISLNFKACGVDLDKLCSNTAENASRCWITCYLPTLNLQSVVHRFHIEEIYGGMSNNRRITDYVLPFDFHSDCDVNFDVLEKLRKNRSALYRAVEFAKLTVLDKQSAETFELFIKNPGFRREVSEVTGRTEAEVLPFLKSAQHYLRDNYLVITGVVQQDVLECHPAGVTQADALNKDCWSGSALSKRQ
ncbi:hypothetical protein HPB49_006742 [Dermacentor silvarum]|uniref:Uncharacterized protein n=1 Tax=Dermacentor silvarum TaxID=543639 RepID=A0ACB8DWZ1_DERSI|nr:hypothetical protein HPB49_006742 [Dermacentor silvarum]